MPTSFGEPLTKLRAVPILENHEPLVDPRSLSARLGFVAHHPKFAKMERDARVRRSVAEMLARAADALPGELELQIVEGFRPLAQQRFMYNEIFEENRRSHPGWNYSTLRRITNQLSAPPEDRCPPPHSTGGAVDVCIVVRDTRMFLDVCSPYEWDQTSAPTAIKGLAPEAKANRSLLVDTLSATGLTNYAGEWWHWSYGDSGWALRTGAEFALYDRLADAGS